MWAIKSSYQFGCVGYLALVELLFIFLYLSIYKGKNTLPCQFFKHYSPKEGILCVLLPLNFALPLLKTRQKRNITFWEYNKVLLGFAGQLWLFWEHQVYMLYVMT